MIIRPILVAALLVAVVSGCGDEDAPAQQTPSADPVASARVGLGEDVIDKPQDEGKRLGDAVVNGGWQFTASDSTCGVKSISLKLYETTVKPSAGHEFCKVNVTVKNVSKRPLSILNGDQNAWAGDTLYGCLCNPEVNVELADYFGYSEMNPGVSDTGTWVFEVPAGDTLTDLEVHGVAALNNGTGSLIHLDR